MWTTEQIEIMLAWMERADVLLRLLCMFAAFNVGYMMYRSLFGNRMRWDRRGGFLSIALLALTVPAGNAHAEWTQQEISQLLTNTQSTWSNVGYINQHTQDIKTSLLTTNAWIQDLLGHTTVNPYGRGVPNIHAALEEMQIDLADVMDHASDIKANTYSTQSRLLHVKTAVEGIEDELDAAGLAQAVPDMMVSLQNIDNDLDVLQTMDTTLHDINGSILLDLAQTTAAVGQLKGIAADMDTLMRTTFFQEIDRIEDDTGALVDDIDTMKTYTRDIETHTENMLGDVADIKEILGDLVLEGIEVDISTIEEYINEVELLLGQVVAANTAINNNLNIIKEEYLLPIKNTLLDIYDDTSNIYQMIDTYFPIYSDRLQQIADSIAPEQQPALPPNDFDPLTYTEYDPFIEEPVDVIEATIFDQEATHPVMDMQQMTPGFIAAHENIEHSTWTIVFDVSGLAPVFPVLAGRAPFVINIFFEPLEAWIDALHYVWYFGWALWSAMHLWKAIKP